MLWGIFTKALSRRADTVALAALGGSQFKAYWTTGPAKGLGRLNSQEETMGSLERKRKYRFEAKDADVEGGEGEAVTHEETSTAPTASLRTKAGMPPPFGTGSTNLSLIERQSKCIATPRILPPPPPQPPPRQSKSPTHPATLVTH